MEPWSDWHTVQLARAVGDSPLCTVNVYREMVEQGTARLFTLRDTAGNPVACYLLTIDLVEGYREAVIVAAASTGTALTAHVLEHIKRQCAGCDFIRAHTWRPGMVRKLKAAGFGYAETVMRYAINGQQKQ